MGTYSTQEFMDLFGGMPEPGEAYDPDPDRRRDEAREDFAAIEARIAEQYADAAYGWRIAESRESEW